MGAKATLQKLDSIHAAIYTKKASNAAVYTAKTSSMLTNWSLSMSVFLTFLILQDIIPECIVSCCVGILLSLAIHYSWVCSDLAHIKKEDKQGHEELKPNFIYFLADFFFDSSYCCIHFSCRQVHCPFISVRVNLWIVAFISLSVNPLLQDIDSVGVCIDNACVWWTLTPYFF